MNGNTTAPITGSVRNHPPSGIRRVTRRDPCPICGKPDWCNHLGDWGAHCERVEQGSIRPAHSSGWIHVLPGHEADWRDTLPAPVPPPKPARPTVDPNLADRAYRTLLARLQLSSTHREGLTARGLTEEQILRHGYVTGPITRQERQALAAAVSDELGRDLAGLVPGFIRRGGTLDLACGDAELLIPVFDAQGRIAGIRRRIDHARHGGKYRWFSAGDGPHSIGIDGNTVHVARPARPTSARYVVITEGEIKANIVADWLGCIVLSVPGVANIGHVAETLKVLGDVEYVAMALDADSATKAPVAAAEERLGQLLTAANYPVCRWTWELDIAKGLDDLWPTGRMPFPVPWSAAAPSSDPSAPPDSRQDVAEKLEELRRRHALETQARRNPNLGAERHTLVALVHAIAGAQEGESIPVPHSKVGDIAGVSSSTVERQYATVGIKPKEGEAGILAGVVAFDVRPVPEREDPRTGQTYGGYDAVHVRRLAPVDDILARIAAAPAPAKGKRNGHGGKRTPCPECGCTDVRRIVTTYCKGCGVELDSKPLPDAAALTPPPQDAAGGSAEHEQFVAPEHDDRQQLAAQEIGRPSVNVLRGPILRPTPPPQDAAGGDEGSREWDLGLDAPPLHNAQEVLAAASHAAPDTAKQALQDIEAQLARLAVQRGRTPVPKPSAMRAPWETGDYATGAD